MFIIGLHRNLRFSLRISSVRVNQLIRIIIIFNNTINVSVCTFNRILHRAFETQLVQMCHHLYVN